MGAHVRKPRMKHGRYTDGEIAVESPNPKPQNPKKFQIPSANMRSSRGSSVEKSRAESRWLRASETQLRRRYRRHYAICCNRTNVSSFLIRARRARSDA